MGNRTISTRRYVTVQDSDNRVEYDPNGAQVMTPPTRHRVSSEGSFFFFNL